MNGKIATAAVSALMLISLISVFQAGTVSASPEEETIVLNNPTTWGANARGATESYIGCGSWANDPSDKMELYLTPELLFGEDITINDIAEISYHTLKSDPQGGVNFYINIYTMPYTDGDSTWYGNRLTLEPMYSYNFDDVVGEWNTWTTNAGTNQLTVFDSNHAPYGWYYPPTFSDIQVGPINWNAWIASGKVTNIDYASQTVKYIVLATGTPWCETFEGRVDALTIKLKDGNSVTVDLEPGVINQNTGAGYNTIQEAIDAASPGDTVLVYPGTYYQNLVIDRSLTLQGGDRETTVIQSTLDGGLYPDMMPGYGDRVIIVESSDVTVTGFTISGYTGTEEKRGSTPWGIYADGEFSNIEVTNNIFTFYTQNGIQFLNVGNSMISGNIFKRETKNVWYDPPGVEPGRYVDRTYGGMGPALWGGANCVIYNNTISTYAVGIFLMGPEGTLVENNLVSAPDTEKPSDSGIHIQNCSDTTIRGNVVENFTAGPSSMYTHGLKGAGIHVYSNNVTIENNDIKRNTVGVYVATKEGLSSPTNIVVNYNNIEDSSDYGVLNIKLPASGIWNYWDYDSFSPADATIDATLNWWGHPSGPSGVGPGTGDAVNENVDYTPWFATENPSEEAMNVELIRAGETIAWSETIQAAIDAANHGDTVLVHPGTYAEAISIGTDNLVLQSESELGAIIRPSTTPGWPWGAVNILADGVTVDGFEIDGTTVCNNGILGWETSGLTIKNNKIHGAVNAWDGCGILLFSWGNSGTVYNNLIENNEVYDTGRMGIMVMDHGVDYTVTSGNIITGNIVHDVWKVAWGDHGGGIQINVGKNCSITNNEVYNVENGQRGIYMFGSATGNTISYNTLRDNPIGIQLWISGEGGTPIDWGGDIPASPQVHYNNIYNNGSGAISSNIQGTPMVMNATHNWWGHPSGPRRDRGNPNCKAGRGDRVSENVRYHPWLSKPFQTVLEKHVGHYGFEGRYLEKGWNTLSVPIYLDNNAWEEIAAYLDENIAYRFNASTQAWELMTTDSKLDPLDAIYIRMNSEDSVPLVVSVSITNPPVKELKRGWNLIGLAAWEVENMSVDRALVSVELTPDGNRGYTIVVSSSLNQEYWAYTIGQTKKQLMHKNEGYWVYMENPGNLAGFSTTPLPFWEPE